MPQTRLAPICSNASWQQGGSPQSRCPDRVRSCAGTSRFRATAPSSRSRENRCRHTKVCSSFEDAHDQRVTGEAICRHVARRIRPRLLFCAGFAGHAIHGQGRRGLPPAPQSARRLRARTVVERLFALQPQRQIEASADDRWPALFLSLAASREVRASLQRCLDEAVEIAVKHGTGIADFVAGTQILDTRLVKHVAADLVAPADVALGCLPVCCASMRLRSSCS